MAQHSFSVDIAEMKIAHSPDCLYSLALGSCIGVAIFDPIAGIGGLIHVLLPSFSGFDITTHSRKKFADSGINDLVNEMVINGASRLRMRAKMAGGATMFLNQNGFPGGSIGERNIESGRLTLKRLGIQLIAQDVGGNKGRTIYFDIQTGSLRIKMSDKQEKTI
ncbi:MAG: chemotaxis protein CheD [Oscillospiraceae bacterium]